MSNQTTWSGTISNTWSDPSNWTKGVPSIGIHAYIPPSASTPYQPVINKNVKINFTVKNDGFLHIHAEILLQNKGMIQNYGTIQNHTDGTVVNEGNIMNFGEWVNEGTCDNKRIFTNKYRMFNEGIFDNENTFVNIGDLVNTGIIDNHKAINNSGNLENFNIIENHGFSEILDSGFFPEEFVQDTNETPIAFSNNTLLENSVAK